MDFGGGALRKYQYLTSNGQKFEFTSFPKERGFRTVGLDRHGVDRRHASLNLWHPIDSNSQVSRVEKQLHIVTKVPDVNLSNYVGRHETANSASEYLGKIGVIKKVRKEEPIRIVQTSLPPPKPASVELSDKLKRKLAAIVKEDERRYPRFSAVPAKKKKQKE